MAVPITPLALRLARYVLPGGRNCWLWTGAKNEHGYGVIGRGSRGTGNIKAHRAMYQLFHGVVLEPSTKILHACDNPACVNPLHLRPGTQADNHADMRLRGRYSPPPIRCGERNNKARLTEANIHEIFRLRACGLSTYFIAHQFGVSRPTVCAVLNRRTWRNIDVADY